MTKSMQEYYFQYGDAVSFDITYKVCSVTVDVDDEKMTTLRWNVGLFSCFLKDLRPVICGICFIVSEKVEDFVSLFLMFY